MARRLKVDIQSWPIRGEFRIARGAKTEALVVVAEIAEGAATGRGECVPIRATARASSASLPKSNRCAPISRTD
jgi:hypothetical protein